MEEFYEETTSQPPSCVGKSRVPGDEILTLYLVMEHVFMRDEILF